MKEDMHEDRYTDGQKGVFGDRHDMTPRKMNRPERRNNSLPSIVACR